MAPGTGTDDRDEREATGEQDRSRRRRLPGQTYQTWLDDVIRGAEAAGLFDDLPGHGKPLVAEDASESLDEWWLAHRMLKQAGFVPVWIELRKEIAAMRPAVVAALDAYHAATARLDRADPEAVRTLDRLEERYLALAREVNEKVDEHNLLRPAQVEELAKFREDATRRPPRRPAGA